MQNHMQAQPDDRLQPREATGVIFSLILLTAFLGQVYFTPFSGDFRFSLAVPAISLILLYFPSRSPVLYSTVAGVSMLVFRVLLARITQGPAALSTALLQNTPVLLFYVSFGLFFRWMRVAEQAQQSMALFLSLWLCEILANLTELFALNLFFPQPVERAILLIVVIGSLRSGCTAAVYRLSMHMRQRRDNQQREEQYQQMLLFFSSLRTELLFFNKSMNDIEQAMKSSYELYERLKDTQLQGDALAIARRIHELKKDYQRIAANMEKALSEEYQDVPMRISEIFRILQQSTDRLLAARGSQTVVRFVCEDDWLTKEYEIFLAVINNLVINAVEALAATEQAGEVLVTQKREGPDCLLTIQDNAAGIEEELMEYIFEPGFTTKFNPETGRMSSGIGLVHVRHMVETICRGSISVRSTGEGTVFCVRIPLERLTERGEP